MATSRDSIVTALIECLKGIDGTTPYFSAVSQVQRRHPVAAQIPFSQMPFIGIEEGDEIYEVRLKGCYKVTFPIVLCLQTYGDDEDQARENMGELIYDVSHALDTGMEDTLTLQPHLYSVTLTRSEPTEILNERVARTLLAIETLRTQSYRRT